MSRAMKPKHKHKRTRRKPVALSLEEIKALPLEKKRRLHLVPQVPHPGMLVVRGDEVIEALFLAKDPDRQRKDILLLRAKWGAGYAKATHFTNSELRAVSWFAHLPEVSGDIEQIVFDEGNFLASGFWRIWKREPTAVLRLAGMIRNPPNVKGHKDVEDVLTNPQKYSSSGDASRKKATQRALQHLKPPERIAKFAVRLRR